MNKSNLIDLERQVFHLQTLYEIAHSLNNCRTRPQIYREILSILMGTLGVEYGVSLDFSKEWSVIAERGFEKDISPGLESSLLSSGFDSKPSAMKKKLIMNFISKQKKSELSEAHTFWLEFVGREKVVGGLFLGMKLSGEVYSETDDELLEAVASHSTTALENLQLYEELKDAQERLQLENIALREEVLREYEDGRIIGQSEGILKILQQARNVAKSPTNVAFLYLH